jgi:hypothetical protein
MVVTREMLAMRTIMCIFEHGRDHPESLQCLEYYGYRVRETDSAKDNALALMFALDRVHTEVLAVAPGDAASERSSVTKYVRDLCGLMRVIGSYITVPTPPKHLRMVIPMLPGELLICIDSAMERLLELYDTRRISLHALEMQYRMLHTQFTTSFSGRTVREINEFITLQQNMRLEQLRRNIQRPRLPLPFVTRALVLQHGKRAAASMILGSEGGDPELSTSIVDDPTRAMERRIEFIEQRLVPLMRRLANTQLFHALCSDTVDAIAQHVSGKMSMRDVNTILHRWEENSRDLTLRELLLHLEELGDEMDLAQRIMVRMWHHGCKWGEGAVEHLARDVRLWSTSVFFNMIHRHTVAQTEPDEASTNSYILMIGSVFGTPANEELPFRDFAEQLRVIYEPTLERFKCAHSSYSIYRKGWGMPSYTEESYVRMRTLYRFNFMDDDFSSNYRTPTIRALTQKQAKSDFDEYMKSVRTGKVTHEMLASDLHEAHTHITVIHAFAKLLQRFMILDRGESLIPGDPDLKSLDFPPE